MIKRPRSVNITQDSDSRIRVTRCWESLAALTVPGGSGPVLPGGLHQPRHVLLRAQEESGGGAGGEGYEALGKADPIEAHGRGVPAAPRCESTRNGHGLSTPLGARPAGPRAAAGAFPAIGGPAAPKPTGGAQRAWHGAGFGGEEEG